MLGKYKVPIALLAITVISLFLRAYHLSDWLHFQLDQARDAYLIKDIIEKGLGELPLLGPRAGGSFLRLGPFYYYLMYLLALAARSVHPAVFVLPEILASVAFIPMFYLLARRLLNQNWSLILTALAANSTFLITYDRFSWNPNLMPLFTVTTTYSWLKYLEFKRKNNGKKSALWIALSALSAGLLIQLHFEAFVALPVILAVSAVFLCWELHKSKKQDLKTVAFLLGRDLIIFVAIILATHLPMILNEYISKGANTKEFFTTVTEKQDKDKLHNLTEQLLQNVTVYPKGFYNVLTGDSGVYFPTVLTRPNLNLLCDYDCRYGYLKTGMATILFLTVGIFFLFYLGKKAKKIFSLKRDASLIAKNTGEFEFLVLLFTWMLVPWWAFYSISFNLRPRFFLFVVVPFWIITGLFIREVYGKKPGKILALSIVLILFITNFSNTYFRYNELASAEITDKGSYPEDQIFYRNERYPTTLRQQTQISQWVKEKYQEETADDDYLFLWAPPYFYRPILYLLSTDEFDDKLQYFSNKPSWQNASYFAVCRTTNPADFFNRERSELFKAKDQRSFGTLTVFQLELTEKGLETAREGEKKFRRRGVITDPVKTKQKCLEKPKPECRFVWGDII
jgi:hypothetical protein